MNDTCPCPSATMIAPYSWLAINAGAKARRVFVLVHQYKAPLGKPIGIDGTVYNYAVCTMNACSFFTSRIGPLTTYLSSALCWGAWLTSTRQCLCIFSKLFLKQWSNRYVGCAYGISNANLYRSHTSRRTLCSRVSNLMQNDCSFHLVCKTTWIFGL